jgi:hypothetical protein
MLQHQRRRLQSVLGSLLTPPWNRDVTASSLVRTSCGRESHLLQHGAPAKAVGIRERLDDLEVVVALSD